MSTCPHCGQPALPVLGVCAGHSVLFGLQGIVEKSSSPMGQAVKPALNDMGELIAAGLNAWFGRTPASSPSSGSSGRPAEVSGLELLRTLGFRPTASVPTVQEVEAFRRRMAKAYHSDQGAGPVDPEMLARINAACDEVKASIPVTEPNPPRQNSQKKRRPS